MKALTAVDEGEDDRKARRLVFAKTKIEALTRTIDALTRQRARFVKHARVNALPDGHPALVAVLERQAEALAHIEARRRGEEAGL